MTARDPIVHGLRAERTVMTARDLVVYGPRSEKVPDHNATLSSGCNHERTGTNHLNPEWIHVGPASCSVRECRCTSVGRHRRVSQVVHKTIRTPRASRPTPCHRSVVDGLYGTNGASHGANNASASVTCSVGGNRACVMAIRWRYGIHVSSSEGGRN